MPCEAWSLADHSRDISRLVFPDNLSSAAVAIDILGLNDRIKTPDRKIDITV